MPFQRQIVEMNICKLICSHDLLVVDEDDAMKTFYQSNSNLFFLNLQRICFHIQIICFNTS